MSYLSRILKKQKRITDRLKKSPIISIRGFGRDEILVFQTYYYAYSSIEMEKDSTRIQLEASQNKYKDLKEFDSFHTPDVEFSHLYWGKYPNRYHRETKKRLIEVGKEWRLRVQKDYPNSNINIVVHFEPENKAWFLDAFNWDIRDEWTKEMNSTIWL